MTEPTCPDATDTNPFLELIHTVETMSPEKLRTALREFLDSQAGAAVPARQRWSRESRQAIHDALALEIEALSTPATMWSHGTVLFGAQMLTTGITGQILDPGAAAQAFEHVSQILAILRTETERTR